MTRDVEEQLLLAGLNSFSNDCVQRKSHRGVDNLNYFIIEETRSPHRK